MKKYDTADIRNIVVLGGSAAGKTTMLEAVAFAAGVKNKLGSVTEGNTTCDYDSEEKKRGFSIDISLLPVEWNGCKINFIDTPGGLDFIGERESAASVADGAIIVVNGKKGVDAGTYAAWNICDRYKLPRLIFVTAMDDDNASYRDVVDTLIGKYGSRVAPFHMPIRQEQRLIGYADITRMKGRRFTGICKFEDMEIPDYSMEYLKNFRSILDEAVAAVDEDNMDKFFEGEEFTEHEMESGLRSDCMDGSIVPVTMGSGLNVHGIFMLLDSVVKYMPAPIITKTGINVANNELFDCIYDSRDSFVARVFKTISDPYKGKYSLIKVYSGALKSDDNVFNAALDSEQKVSRLYYMSGGEFIQTDELVAGDIGAVPKLYDIFTGDILSTKVVPVKFDPVEFEVPYTSKRIVIKDKKDDDKLLAAISRMLEEDRTLMFENDSENGQQLIVGIGEQQLSIFKDRLSSRYKIEIELEAPKIAYRETICSRVEGVKGRYKKQSGGHGQFGDVVMTFQPSGDRDTPYIFEETVVGGAVPKNYFGAVEKGIEESVKKGLLAGYPVIGFKAILTDGSYHPVDSSDNAFKMAAITAFKEGYMKAEPIILEPIAKVKIYVPSQFTGDVISDLKTRNSRVLGLVPENEFDSYIEADIPIAQLDGYLAKLRSISGGSGRFEYEFSRYGKVSEATADRLIKEFAKVSE